MQIGRIFGCVQGFNASLNSGCSKHVGWIEGNAQNPFFLCCSRLCVKASACFRERSSSTPNTGWVGRYYIPCAKKANPLSWKVDEINILSVTAYFMQHLRLSSTTRSTHSVHQCDSRGLVASRSLERCTNNQQCPTSKTLSTRSAVLSTVSITSETILRNFVLVEMNYSANLGLLYLHLSCYSLLYYTANTSDDISFQT